jgi:hypothetical protein
MTHPGFRSAAATVCAGLALATFVAATALAQPAPDRTVLPIHEPTYPHSTVLDVRNAPPAPPRFEVKAPAGAPNVLIVLIDDMGFGQSGAFGGPLNRPTVERLAQGGLGTILVNGKKVAEGRIARTQPGVFSADEGADVGEDGETPVVEDYGVPAPYRFTGKIAKVTVEVAPMPAPEKAAEGKARAETAQKKALAE